MEPIALQKKSFGLEPMPQTKTSFLKIETTNLDLAINLRQAAGLS